MVSSFSLLVRHGTVQRKLAWRIFPDSVRGSASTMATVFGAM
jgi:hypothetical protein